MLADIAGTTGYEAPEADHDVMCYNSDIYSAACTVICSVREVFSDAMSYLIQLVGKQSMMIEAVNVATKGARALQQQCGLVLVILSCSHHVQFAGCWLASVSTPLLVALWNVAS